MQFASLPFFVFFVFVATITWVFGKTTKTRNTILLLASYVFYSQISLNSLALLVFHTGINYSISELLYNSSVQYRKIWLYLGVGFNIGLLIVCKYFLFLSELADAIGVFFEISAHTDIIHVVLPIGISFYTFQSIAYLVDIYKSAHQSKYMVRAKNIVEFALFQAFFPQLLIGPICRSVDILPQIQRAPLTHVPNFYQAGLLILSGLWKKVILSTVLFENGSLDVFYDPDQYSAIGLWGGMIGYSIQLYCDFSGYTDLARGFALLLGFSLPENFRGPYGAHNIGEFWKRWHITFSQWLRDYIYIPLGGSRGTPLRTYTNLCITFLVCGIWHGASWGFVIWGASHGIALAWHKYTIDKQRAQGTYSKHIPTGWNFWSGWLLTFVFVAASRVFFVAPSVDIALLFLQRLVDFSHIGLGTKLTLSYAVSIGLLINLYGENFFITLCGVVERVPIWLYSICVYILVCTILVLRPGGIPPYLYFQF